MQLTEIRIAGFGGQGVILSAMVLGKAASIFQKRFATVTQNFGPEARGGACSAQLILSDSAVLYPYVTHPDILVVMSQEAFNRFTPELKDGGTLVVEQDLVRVTGLDGKKTIKVFGIPATRIAEGLGKKMVLNSVMVGFFTALTQLLDADAVRRAVSESVPPIFRELNLEAFELGFKQGKVASGKGGTELELQYTAED